MKKISLKQRSFQTPFPGGKKRWTENLGQKGGIDKDFLYERWKEKEPSWGKNHALVKGG
jgi:hypothetical protein